MCSTAVLKLSNSQVGTRDWLRAACVFNVESMQVTALLPCFSCGGGAASLKTSCGGKQPRVVLLTGALDQSILSDIHVCSTESEQQYSCKRLLWPQPTLCADWVNAPDRR